jgi:16S rRNA (guanine1516-N2)-methyltransferase
VANAQRFGLTVADVRDTTRWQLMRSADRMQLHAPTELEAIAIDLHLGSGPLVKRLRSSRRTDALPRACGLPRRERMPTILDATAGLCRDAMVLGHLGCSVTAIERIAALAFLAHDAIEPSWLAAHVAVRSASAEQWLQTLPAESRPEVIYLDPMFGPAGKAQVKKEMQVCRALAGPPDDPLPLFALARQIASERVVVKRHHGAEPLADGISFVVEGERVRFDVYLPRPDQLA